MSIDTAQAATAYARTAATPIGDATGTVGAGTVTAGGGGFADLVSRALDGAVAAGRESDRMTVKAIANQADLNEVVTAVSSAELTLQTVVAVRDRVIQAYQDIIRMPI